MKNYVDAGLPYVSNTNSSLVLTNNGSYILGTNTTYALDSEVSAVNTSMKNYVDAGLPYVSSTNSSLVLTNNGSYVKTNNGSYILGTNTSYVLTNNGSYVQVTNTSYVRNPVFGYTTLMAGSAMIGTTNPVTMSQTETSTNKNNFISVDFTDGGTEVAQWIMEFPDDWNYSATVSFTPVWTATSGSGTARFDVYAKLFPDSAALDTELPAIAATVDTLITTGDVHVADPTSGVITSVGTGGNTAIIKVLRNSGVDTLSGTVKLIGLRVKYSRILA
jgi:hypothetical protein